MSYKFIYKRDGFFSFSKTIDKVVGHKYMQDQDKMVIYKEDGSLQEIAKWSLCAVTLGTDWVAAIKKTMEQEAGTVVPLNIKGQ